MNMEKVRRRFYLTFGPDTIPRPLIWEVGQKFRVVTNVRTASISDSVGLVALELDGAHDEIERAVSFFRANGVKAEPIELNVVDG